MKQWHYEVRTTLPVGDAPREADSVLLRRTGQGTPPFRGLWRHLTTWSILEFKGPSISPRRRDIDLLIELGLGIDRRLHEERVRRGQRPLGPGEFSLWYLAITRRRFVGAAQEKLGELQPLGTGLWRCRLLERLVFLVSSIDLPVEVDSLPLHIVGHEPLATERQVARLVTEEATLERLYSGWVATLHPRAWKEMEIMARTMGRKLKLDLRPAIEYLGVGQVIEQLGLERVIGQVGIDRVIEHAGIDRVIEKVGVDRVIEKIGPSEVFKRMGVDRFLASLSAAERREPKRRLQ
jgi:hypothetical protein